MPCLQVASNTATIRFQFATTPTTAAATKAGFLSCVLPHHVDAGASGKVVLQVHLYHPVTVATMRSRALCIPCAVRDTLMLD